MTILVENQGQSWIPNTSIAIRELLKFWSSIGEMIGCMEIGKIDMKLIDIFISIVHHISIGTKSCNGDLDFAPFE